MNLVLAGGFREPARWHLLCKNLERGAVRGEKKEES